MAIAVALMYFRIQASGWASCEDKLIPYIQLAFFYNIEFGVVILDRLAEVNQLV